MFMDALLLVSDAQAITADAVSTNTIDLGNPTVKRRIGTGEAVGFQVGVDVAADITTGDETYQVEIIADDDPALGSPTTIAEFTLSAAQLALGKKYFLPLPPGMPDLRYIGLRFDVGGTTPTLTVTAGLIPASMAEPENTIYAKGYSN